MCHAPRPTAAAAAGFAFAYAAAIIPKIGGSPPVPAGWGSEPRRVSTRSAALMRV